MELELNKPYTSEEIARNEFNVSAKTFSNKRDIYLEKLSSKYKWEYKKRKYILLEKLNDNNLQRASKIEIQQEIRQPVHDVVSKNTLQTYSSIARIMVNNNVSYVKKHPQQENTMVRYIRAVMETDYAVKEWVWGDINQLPIQPLTQDQKEYLTVLMAKKDGLSLDQLSFMIKAMEESGYITKEEAKDLLYDTATKDYEDVMRGFKQKYHFRPRLVADWQEGIAFDADIVIPYGLKNKEKLLEYKYDKN